MTIAQIIKALEDRHVKLPPEEKSCDGVIYGDISKECSGIVLTCCATASVLKEAAALGCNLVISHEPTFYHGCDDRGWLKGTEIYETKVELLRAHGIVVYRDHDRVHRENRDMIYTGIIKRLGWEKYALGEDFFPVSGYELPEMTLEELGKEVSSKLQLDGIRFIGDPKMKVKKAALTAHFFGGTEDEKTILEIENNNYDVVIPLETVDWTIITYILDSCALGRPKALLNVGHFNLEEPGMEMLKPWLFEIVGNIIPIHFIPAGNFYHWLESGKKNGY